MTQPQIKSSWLSNGQTILLVLYPNGIERVMSQTAFVKQMNEGFWTLSLN
jgi:predicted RNA-binding protein (virulence factor B family)